MLQTLYAKRIPTTDKTLLDWVAAGHAKLTKVHQDVAIATGADFSNVLCIYPWHKTHKPTKRNKYITQNCWRYKLVWVD